MEAIKGYLAALVDPQFGKNGVKVAAIVGSILLAINHGPALMQNQMTRDRWLSALVTYLIPYGVNVHGQYISQRQTKRQPQVTITED
ncbi:nitrate/nitrite transporter NrtS [Almyronema epifaneia]|uniref:Nitrate/nitrite transporter NrtS n=1 Tax=Almyronema epifaneia S1 TaxID=2991925 RepID=A0ABW6ICH4_9CYAN